MKRFVILLAGMMIILLALGSSHVWVRAQDDATAEATSDTPTEEIPTATPPVPILEITAEPTPLPTESPPAEATPEITLEPTTVTPEITSEAPQIPPEPPLNLGLTVNFDAALNGWILGPGWSHNGSALQLIDSDQAASPKANMIQNLAVQVRTQIQSGALRLNIRHGSSGSYSTVFGADGRLELYRAGILLQSAQLNPPGDGWHTVRISAVDNIVRAAVDGEEILVYSDASPLTPGGISFAGSGISTLQIDDLEIWVAGGEAVTAPDSDTEVIGQATCSSTTPITYGAAPINSALSVMGEEDCYTFSGVAGDQIRLRAIHTNGSIWIVKDVLRPDGTTLCTLGNALDLNCTLNVTGTYTIVIRFGANYAVGYNLYLQRLNSPSGCTPMEYAAPILSGDFSGLDSDCYTFSGAAGDRILIRTMGSSASGRTQEILRPNGTTVCGPSTGVEIRCNLDATQTYTILINDFNGQPFPGGYAIYLQRLNSPIGCTATQYANPAISGSFVGTVKTDCYTFNGELGDALRIRALSYGAGSGGVYKEILRPNGTTLCGPVSNNPPELTCTLDVAGQYTILITAVTGSDIYTVYVQRLINPLGCTPIVYGNGIAVSGMLSAPAAMDCFTFDGIAGEKVRVRGIRTSAGGQPSREILRSNGTTLCGPNPWEDLTCDLDATDIYTILVTIGGGMGAPDNYDLSLQRVNDPLGCGVLSYAGIPQDGTFTFPADMDCYRFTGTAGEKVRVRSLRTDGIQHMKREILRADGTGLCGPTYDLDLNCNLDVTGDYTVIITDWAYPTFHNDPYKVALQRLNNPLGCTSIGAYGQVTSGTLDAAAEIDCYTFNGTAEEKLRLRVAQAASTPNMNMTYEVLRPDGTTVCGPTTSEGVCNLPTTDTYTVMIWDASYVTGGYNLYLQRSVNPVGCTNVSYDNVPFNAAITLTAEMDCYTFAGAAGENVLFTLAKASGTFTPQIEIFDSAATLLCSDDDPSRILLTCPLNSSGTYTAYVRPLSATTIGTYSLSIDTGWYLGRHSAASTAADEGPIEIKVSADFSRIVEIRGNLNCLRTDKHPYLYRPGLSIPVAEGRFFALNLPLDIPSSPGHTHSLNIDGQFFDSDGNGTLDQVYGGLNFRSGATNCSMQWRATGIIPDGDSDGWSNAAETALGSSPTNAARTPENGLVPTTTLASQSVCVDFYDNDGDGLTDVADSGCPPPPSGVSLQMEIIAPGRISPGQKGTYILKYTNIGMEDANDVLLFTKLDDNVRFISASNNGEYNPIIHGVDWNLGRIRPQELGEVSIEVETLWGLLLGTTIEYRGSLTYLNSDLSTLSAADSDTNIYVNGIGMCTNVQKTLNENFANSIDATWIKAYYLNCSSFINPKVEDILDVGDANVGIAWPNNGLENPLLLNGEYSECWGYSGGTVSIVAGLQYGTATCDHLILISPFLTDNAELQELHDSGAVDRITVLQSPDDVTPGGQLIQYKIDPSNPWYDPLNRPPWFNFIEHAGIVHNFWIDWLWECMGRGGDRFGMGCDDPFGPTSFRAVSSIIVGKDPNAKQVDLETVAADGLLNYTVEFENEGEGIAYGVYVTDTLEADINVATLNLPANEGGVYDPNTRTITWYVGELASKGKGEFQFSVRVRADAACGTEVTNYATVYFPSVPEVTPTNGVSTRVVGPDCDGDSDGHTDLVDNCATVYNPADADGDGQDGEDIIDGLDNDSDGLVDEDYEVGQEDNDNDGQGDPCDEDDDNDTMIDAFEVAYSCLKPFVNDTADDPDGDNQTNAQEFAAATDPCPHLEPPSNAPNLTKPLPNAVTNDITPEFCWTTVADSYQLQVDDSTDFASPLLDITTDQICHTPASPLPDGALSWRVRGSNSAGDGPWSQTGSFTIASAPQLRLPADNTIVLSGRPTFMWRRFTGATTYILQMGSRIGGVCDFTAPIERTGLRGTTYSLNISLQQGEYCWRMAVADANGVRGNWSPARTLLVNIQITPRDGTVFITRTKAKPTFTWTPIRGAVEYELVLFNTPTCATGTDIYRFKTSRTSRVLPVAQSLSSGRYGWHVNLDLDPNPNAGLVESPFCWVFTVSPPAPPAPRMLSPPNGVLFNTTSHVLDWQDVTDTYGPVTYQLSLRKSPFPASITPVAVSQYALDVLDGRWCWNVRTVNYLGVAGRASPTRCFTVDTQAPSAPVTISPAEGAVVKSVRPRFSWRASMGAPKSYAIQITRRDSNMCDFLHVEEGTRVYGTSYTPTNSLPQGEHCWRVSAIDAAGNQSAWSAYIVFAINNQLSPPENAYLVASSTPARVMFSWSRVPEAANYRLVVVAGTPCLESNILHDITLTGTTRVLTPGLGYGVYSWIVFANIPNVGLSESRCQSFSVTPPAPPRPTLVSPANGATVATDTPTLIWNGVTYSTPVIYRVQVDNDSNFSSPEVDTIVSATSHTLSALPEGTYYWRVRALNGLNLGGLWSTSWRFSVDLP